MVSFFINFENYINVVEHFLQKFLKKTFHFVTLLFLKKRAIIYSFKRKP